MESPGAEPSRSGVTPWTSVSGGGLRRVSSVCSPRACEIKPLAHRSHILEVLKRTITVFILLLTSVGLASLSAADIGFTETTNAANLSYSGLSFGAAWGDLNNDGFPDLWVGNHSAAPPSLYLNNGDGTFTDVGEANWAGFLGDPHGVAWADFDNDGDQDLYEIHGGCCRSRLYVNDGSVLTEQAIAHGVDYQTGRGRTPTWMDVDRDGALDLVAANTVSASAPTTIFRQLADSTFEDVGLQWGLNVSFSPSAQMSDQDGDNQPELIFNGSQGPSRVFSTSGSPIVEVTSMHPVPNVSGVNDVAIGDFDGNQISDFFYARTASSFDLVQTDANTVAAQLVTDEDEQPFTFQTTGIITVEVGPPWRENPSSVFIGSAGSHPVDLTFDLDPTESGNWGIMPHTPGAVDGVFVGFDPVTARWTIERSTTFSTNIYLRVRSSAPISNLDITWNKNFVPTLTQVRILSLGSGQYATTHNGLFPSACVSATTADFDNDMDLDVFLACTGAASNIENMLFENVGDGFFTAVPGAGGAAGTSLGRSDITVSADYDVDGWVDLFVANGHGPPPLADGPHQLFKNDGGTNHWLEIDLEGTISNRDGIGAIVLVEAGGIVQEREQGGGMHTYSQDFRRLHFGLAGNVSANTVIVYWPSGVEQVLENVTADQVLQIVEPMKEVALSNKLVFALVLIGSAIFFMGRWRAEEQLL